MSKPAGRPGRPRSRPAKATPRSPGKGCERSGSAKGLEFEYWLGVQKSPLFANTFVVRAADLDDPDKKAFLEKYLRGWAMGLEFGYHNPRAAVEAVFEQFPTLASNLGPKLGTTSCLQQTNVFRGDMAKRAGWGDHNMARLAALLRQDLSAQADHQAGQGRGRLHQRAASPAPTTSTTRRSRPTPTATSSRSPSPISTSRTSRRISSIRQFRPIVEPARGAARTPPRHDKPEGEGQWLR